MTVRGFELFVHARPRHVLANVFFLVCSEVNGHLVKFALSEWVVLDPTLLRDGFLFVVGGRHCLDCFAVAAARLFCDVVEVDVTE